MKRYHNVIIIVIMLTRHSLDMEEDSHHRPHTGVYNDHCAKDDGDDYLDDKNDMEEDPHHRPLTGGNDDHAGRLTLGR